MNRLAKQVQNAYETTCEAGGKMQSETENEAVSETETKTTCETASETCEVKHVKGNKLSKTHRVVHVK